MKEIKATAPTRKELYQEYKRLSEENERLAHAVMHQEWVIENLRDEIDSLNNLIGDLKDE